MAEARGPRPRRRQRPASSGPRWRSVRPCASTTAAIAAGGRRPGSKRDRQIPHTCPLSPRSRRATAPAAPPTAASGASPSIRRRTRSTARSTRTSRRARAAGRRRGRRDRAWPRWPPPAPGRRRPAPGAPKRPPSRISAGPDGQSVLTTGQPQAIAWIRTPGRPSNDRRQGEGRGARHVGERVGDEARQRRRRRQCRAWRPAPQPADAPRVFVSGSPWPKITRRPDARGAQPGERPDQRRKILGATQPADAHDHRRRARLEPAMRDRLRAAGRPAPACHRIVDRGDAAARAGRSRRRGRRRRRPRPRPWHPPGHRRAGAPSAGTGPANRAADGCCATRCVR